jgi:hypothetical protein
LNNPDIQQIRACYDAVLDYHRIAFNTRTERVLEIDSGLQRLLEMKSIKGNLLNSIFVILEQAGYLKLADGIKSKSSFRFLLTKDKLKEYIKKLKNNDSKELLLNLIQYYGQTPFVREVIINYKEIMEVSGISIDKIKDNFERLNSVGVLDLIIPVEKSGVEMLRERTSSSQLILDKAEIEMRAGHSFDKLGKVIEYAFTKDCRFNYILRYFGEIKDDYSCGKCDNCREQNTESLSDEYLTEIIVRTFKEFQGGLTSSRLIGILTGKSKSQIAKSISTYGSCRHYSNDSLEKVINMQVSKNVIKVIKDKLFFQPLSDLFADNDKDIVTEEADYESTLELYNKLREERAAASKKFSQPQELICTDKTLREIARIKPKTASEFLQIRDINQRMFNKIGIEFLEVITDHLNRSAGGSKLSELPKHIAQTYKLIKKGYKLSDISNLLKLPESIVSLQIESIISYFPDENYRSLLTDKEFEEVEKVIHEYGTDEKTIKKRLPSKYSYAQIRVIKAVLGSSRP